VTGKTIQEIERERERERERKRKREREKSIGEADDFFRRH
jgi:hypothetical protein